MSELFSSRSVPQSGLLGKRIRSHSLRISFITDLLRTTPIEKVKVIVGRTEIRSTLCYNRNTLGEKEREEIMSALDQTRAS